MFWATLFNTGPAHSAAKEVAEARGSGKGRETRLLEKIGTKELVGWRKDELFTSRILAICITC